MSKVELVKRYIIFILGLFVSAVGVAMTTKAGLGTSPVASLSYVMSLALPQLSLGTWTAVQNILLVLAQAVIARRAFPKIQYLQILVAFGFGVFVDLGTLICTPINPTTYVGSIIWLLVACVILGFGLALEFMGDVLILPGEGLVRVIHQHFHKNLGNTKMAMDCSMVAGAVLLSFLLMGGLYGVREGTIIAAFLVGNIVRFFNPCLKKIEQKYVCPQKKEGAAA